MKIVLKAQNPELEYRSTMQSAALCFMQRHQGEHLDNDQQLFVRAVTYLQTSLEVPLYLAETLAALAYSELRSTGDQRRLDLANSSESVAVLTDPTSGNAYAIPVAHIFEQLIDLPGQRQTPPTI
ncbi:hypothetical protein [Pseudomonas bohemica]|uniref:hypothetical protein n=1 Tax=Pseudomonas bohemica TaxID=2044872 RepID=UPI000DA614D5|nr:hypothetical protein [Pseudomonas bohemica]